MPTIKICQDSHRHYCVFAVRIKTWLLQLQCKWSHTLKIHKKLWHQHTSCTQYTSLVNWKHLLSQEHCWEERRSLQTWGWSRDRCSCLVKLKKIQFNRLSNALMYRLNFKYICVIAEYNSMYLINWEQSYLPWCHLDGH